MYTQFFQFVEHHWMLWLAFVVVLAAIIFEEARKSFRPTTSLSPQALVNLINHEETLVVDVRDNKAFKTGHIINAINVPKNELQKHDQKLSQHKEKNLAVVAATEEEATKIANQLKLQGFSKVHILAEGIGAWQKANLPLVQKK